MTTQIWQGDVCLEKSPQVMDLSGWKKLPHKIVAYGEATGHKHQFCLSDNVELYENAKGELVVRVLALPAALVHDKHFSIPIPEVGDYVYVPQREYTPTLPKRVVD